MNVDDQNEAAVSSRRRPKHKPWTLRLRSTQQRKPDSPRWLLRSDEVLHHYETERGARQAYDDWRAGRGSYGRAYRHPSWEGEVLLRADLKKTSPQTAAPPPPLVGGSAEESRPMFLVEIVISRSVPYPSRPKPVMTAKPPPPPAHEWAATYPSEVAAMEKYRHFANDPRVLAAVVLRWEPGVQGMEGMEPLQTGSFLRYTMGGTPRETVLAMGGRSYDVGIGPRAKHYVTSGKQWVERTEDLGLCKPARFKGGKLPLWDLTAAGGMPAASGPNMAPVSGGPYLLQNEPVQTATAPQP